MCLQLKRKKYMYLSMCSCCNIVSKNPSLVKKHLLTDHSQVSAKKGFKEVIPIRINDKHVRNIRRSLDKKKMHVERNRKENKEIIESCANKENFQWGSSILCIVCKEKYDGLVSYFNHLSAKDHTNGSISFKCTNCQCCFQNLQKFVMHSKTHSGIHNLSIHNIEHVDITESCDKTIQCPYCVKLFKKTEQLHLHIGDKHVMHLKRMKVDVSVETDENVERTEKDTVLLSYNCIHCTETFPTLGSILDHISSHLPDQNVRSPRLTRKRSLPIWLQDTSFDRNVKKIKIVKKDEADAKTDKEQKLKESEVASGERSKRNNESVGKLFSGKVDDPNTTQKKSVQVILPKVMLKSSTASKTEHPSKDRTCIREHFVEVLTERGKRSDVKKIRSKTNDSFQGNVRHIKANSTSFKDIQGQVSECETLSEEMAESIGKSNKLENTSQNTFNSCDSHYESLITESFDEDVDGDSDDDYVPEQDSKESDNAVEALGDTDLYKCQYCDSVGYKHEKSLKRHIRSKHLKKARESPSKILKFHANDNDTEQNGPYRCTYCDEAEYAHTKSLRRHMRAKHPHVFWSSVNVEEAQDSVSEIETNIEGIVDKPIQGTDSRNTNSSDGDLLVKKRKTIAVKEIGSVTSVSKVKCPFCAFYLYHTEYLHSHVRKDHPEVEHFTANDLIKETVSLKLSEVDRECFQCPKCDSSYKWKNSLTCHYRRQHRKEQPLKKVQCILPATWVEKDFASAKFKCPVCHMVFIGKEALEEHTAQHMETKQCNIELRSSLPEPETVNMPRKKLMSFVCPYCDFTSPQKDTLKDHLNVHKDDTDAQILPVIKCILIKPSAFVKTGDKEHKVKECADSSAQENDNSGKNNRDKQKDQEKTDKDPVAPSFNSNLRNGTYICPLCDNFITPSKGQGVKHMELNHADKLPDIELLYVFEAFLEKGTSATKDIVRCVSCEFSSDNLTETLHHSLTEHYENRRDLDTHSEGLEGKRIRTTKSLFKIVSMPSTDMECAEEIYKCWQCEPVHIFKTKKGCKKHMLGQHGDPVLNDVTDILNRMMDVLDVKSVKGYMCVQCKSQMGSDIDLVSHFKEKHPEEVSALEYQMNTLQNQNTYLTDCECEICHKRCLNSLDLQKHLLLHKNKHTLHCPTCGIGFDTNTDMVLHCSNVHSKSTRMCNVCGKMFLRNEQFIQHMRDHERKTEDKNNKRLCQHCGTYISCSLFRKHLLHYHAMHITCDCEICTSQIAPTGCTPVMCKECKTVFCTKLMLNAHIKRVHTEGDFQKGEHYRTPRCVHCNIIFENTLEQHGHRCQKSHKSIRLHSTSAYADADQIEMSENTNRVGIKIPADISNNAIDENILHYNGNMDRPYLCRLCKKTFRVKKYLYYHVRTMHVDAESKRFRCRICKMGCISLATLRQHCKTHLDIRPYQCKICKKGFKSLSNLKEHFRLHDSENPQFVCMYCGCKYVQRAQLMAHVIYHSKLRPFKCPFCHKGFPTNSELKRHMDRYNNDKNIPKDNFICSYCSKQFQNHRHLLQHFFEHNPEDLFHCIVCQKRFSSFGKLYSHKVQTEHFTEKEIEEARQDAQAPGRKFKGMHKDKILYQKRKIKDETEVEAHIIDQSLEIQEHGSSVLVFDDTNYVEVQNNVDDIQTQSSKSALSLLASDALESMFEIHDPDNAVELADGEGIEEYYQQKQTKFIAESVSDLQTQADIPVISVTETGKENVFSIQNTHSDLGSRNISELAFMVAQNQEHGQPQSYQTPDGSIIHVLVVKSNTS